MQNEAELLAEQLDLLRKENKALKQVEVQNRRLLWEKSAYSWTPVIGLCSFLTVAVGFAGFAVWNVMTTPFKIESCHLNVSQFDRGVFEIEAIVPWHPNPIMGSFRSYQEAVDALAKLECSKK